jgi:hypothetical protein
MSFAENPHKIQNIVSAQQEQFRELYHRLALGLPGVHWSGQNVEVGFALRLESRGFVAGQVPVSVRLSGARLEYEVGRQKAHPDLSWGIAQPHSLLEISGVPLVWGTANACSPGVDRAPLCARWAVRGGWAAFSLVNCAEGVGDLPFVSRLSGRAFVCLLHDLDCLGCRS